jgi:hypothetical protein
MALRTKARDTSLPGKASRAACHIERSLSRPRCRKTSLTASMLAVVEFSSSGESCSDGGSSLSSVAWSVRLSDLSVSPRCAPALCHMRYSNASRSKKALRVWGARKIRAIEHYFRRADDAPLSPMWTLKVAVQFW